MIRVKFSCPSCHKSFSVRAASQEALRQQTFSCPACGVSSPFAGIMSKAAPRPGGGAAMHTHIAGAPLSGNPNMKTRVAGQAASTSPMMLVVENTGLRLPLTPGRHIAGRDSSDSTADLRLAPDTYMSRNHAILEVSIERGKPVCRIQALKSANAVIINNIQLAENQCRIITPNDKVVLGMTTFHIENIR